MATIALPTQQPLSPVLQVYPRKPGRIIDSQELLLGCGHMEKVFISKGADWTPPAEIDCRKCKVEKGGKRG